ncbi:MAG: hypothetical protein AB7I30_00900 [Isosphaeraceae bacterium]
MIRNLPFRRIAAPVALGLLLSLAGCAKNDLPPVARVTGTVTYNGKPVPNMMVNFMPMTTSKDQGRPSWGQTDAAGKYEMNYTAEVMGAEIGKHKVYFNPAQVSIDGGQSKESQAEAAKSAGLTPDDLKTILEKYGKEDTTALEVEVNQDPQVLDLKLE